MPERLIFSERVARKSISMNTIDKTSKSSALTIAILTGVTNLMALATSANATIVGINGIGDISNVKLPTTFASNLSSDIGGATVSNGATPDIALTWALSGNGWERHSSDVWNALDPATGTPDIAQIDYDNSNGTDEPTITFAAGAGVALQLNSLDIGHASDQSEAAFAWTITITEDGGPQVFSHTTAAMGPGDTEAVVFNFTGRPGVDYILEFDGADRTNRGALDNLSFNQVVPAADVPAAILAAVPGSLQYSLIYEASIPELTPAWGAGATYTIDNSATGPASFDRVAYIMELDDTWVWVSYDTPLQANTLATVGVPTVATVDGTPIQTTVVNMDVFSSITDANVITTGTGLSSGNIEFWPGNYNQGNDANIPNADPETLDFGDGGAATDVGYGSMQVHNHAASQTIFAFNRWGGAFTGTTDIGIGTNGTGVGEPDYTFSENARNYTTRNLYVLVREGAPTFPPPEATMALSSVAGDKIMLTFSEEVSSDSVDVANFSIAGGPALTAATSSGNIVTLTTSGLVGGTTYTVNYTGVSGLPGRGPALIATVTIDFSAPILPAILASIPAAAGYDLIYHAEIPEAAPRWGNGAPYLVDQSSITDVTAFDRVAYVMELDGDWVFVSFETLSQGSTFATIGIPTVDVVAGTPIQTILSNMDVSSSIAGITEGTGLSGGNIEFWPGNFIPNNVDSIPNADDTTFDWGDGGGSGDLGYGTMQIHNHDASEVLFAFNRWGGGGGTTDIGIGNNPDGAGNPDYVFAENAASFASRNIYVLVRPTLLTLPAAIASSVPEARGYNLVYQMDLPGVNEFSGDAQNIAEAYAADYSATVEPGSRVAYVLQLDDEWVWVSFDAPTDDLTKIGIPHLGVAPTAIQQIVTDMNVASNAPQITRGTFAEGNIEFWSGNYGPENALGIANADEGTFDFGDTMAGGGHGSMQIHNFMESETVFSYNNWGSNNPGQAGGLGIGTNKTGVGEPDWTFSGTSNSYTSRTLYVLTGEPMPFQITSIEVNSGNNEVTVIWPSVEGEIFSISWSDDLEIFTEIDDSVPGGAGSTSFIDIVPAGTPKRFYRVTKEN